MLHQAVLCHVFMLCFTGSCNVLRRAVLLQDLDFSAVIAPKAEAVFDELSDILAPYYMGANAPLAAEDSEADEAADPEGDGSSSSMSAAARAGGVFARLGPALEQLQKYVAKAALLLWLWFDQQCEAMAEEVSWGTALVASRTAFQILMEIAYMLALCCIARQGVAHCAQGVPGMLKHTTPGCMLMSAPQQGMYQGFPSQDLSMPLQAVWTYALFPWPKPCIAAESSQAAMYP